MLDAGGFGESFGEEITDDGQVADRAKRAEYTETDFSSV